MAEVNLLHSGTSLPDPFEGLLLEYLLPPSCSDAFFRRFKFTDGPCLKILLSKCLGTVIILGSMFVKLPQIVKVIGAKNAEGVSFLSVLGELLAITGSLAYSVAYSFPFSAWGEALFVMLQTVVIGFLIQYYSGRTGRGVLFVLLYLGVLSFLLTPLAPATVLTAMQASNMPAIIVSRVRQNVTRTDLLSFFLPFFSLIMCAGYSGGHQLSQWTHGPVVRSYCHYFVCWLTGTHLHLSAGNRRHPAGGHLCGVGGLQRPRCRAGALLLEVHRKVPTKPAGADTPCRCCPNPDQHLPDRI
ncbi:mannose-P-dolichol utilization defect 1 protein-like isoform 1-T1 [Syngnathus typhle]